MIDHIHILSGHYYYVVEDLVNSFIPCFQELGYKVTFDFNKLHDTALNLNMGGTTLSVNDYLKHKDRLITFNMEQICEGSYHMLNQDYFNVLRQSYVWDYSVKNLENLKNLGIINRTFVPIGYHPSMSNIKNSFNPSIDVLFYGLETSRRKKVLDELRDFGLNVVSSGDRLWVRELRNEYIADAKIVLNMHAYDNYNIFEIVRVSHLLANSKCVVGEVNDDTYIEEDVKDCIINVPYDELAKTCKLLIDQPICRNNMEIYSLSNFSYRDQKDYLLNGLFAWEEWRKYEYYGSGSRNI